MTEAAVQLQPRNAHGFTPEDIHRALLALAHHGGNAKQTERFLAEELGLKITDDTLAAWRDSKHADLYRRLHDTHAAEIEAALVPEFRDLALAAASIARKAVEKTNQALDANTLKDPSAAARNLVITAGTAMDKVYMATDRPTTRIEHTDAREILRSLAKHAGTINGTATDPDHRQPPTTGLLGAGRPVNALAGT